jgi:hypothetical protein
MVDAKGPEYAWLLTQTGVSISVAQRLLAQSTDQLAAAGTRQVRWYFAEAEAAQMVRDLFVKSDEGRELIDIRVLPWP